jgi:hypothetical protein
MNKIHIQLGEGRIELEVQFLDNPTAKTISESLPIKSKVQTWGDEIYFNTGIVASGEGATLDVEVGDIAYWPAGKCLCIFFGKTPASSGDKPVPASIVVLIGKTKVDPELLRKVKSGSKISVQ